MTVDYCADGGFDIERWVGWLWDGRVDIHRTWSSDKNFFFLLTAKPCPTGRSHSRRRTGKEPPGPRKNSRPDQISMPTSTEVETFLKFPQEQPQGGMSLERHTRTF